MTTGVCPKCGHQNHEDMCLEKHGVTVEYEESVPKYEYYSELGDVVKHKYVDKQVMVDVTYYHRTQGAVSKSRQVPVQKWHDVPYTDYEYYYEQVYSQYEGFCGNVQSVQRSRPITRYRSESYTEYTTEYYTEYENVDTPYTVQESSTKTVDEPYTVQEMIQKSRVVGHEIVKKTRVEQQYCRCENIVKCGCGTVDGQPHNYGTV